MKMTSFLGVSSKKSCRLGLSGIDLDYSLGGIDLKFIYYFKIYFIVASKYTNMKKNSKMCLATKTLNSIL